MIWVTRTRRTHGQQDNESRSYTPTLNEQVHTPRPSQSPSATQKSKLAAEYREWSFWGFFILSLPLTTSTISQSNLDCSAAFKVLDKSLSLKSLGAQRYLLRINMGCRVLRKKRNWWTVEEDEEDEGRGRLLIIHIYAFLFPSCVSRISFLFFLSKCPILLWLPPTIWRISHPRNGHW